MSLEDLEIRKHTAPLEKELNHQKDKNGLLKKEIADLKKELEWLRFYKREVYYCLGPADDDINLSIARKYKAEGKQLPDSELDRWDGKV